MTQRPKLHSVRSGSAEPASPHDIATLVPCREPATGSSLGAISATPASAVADIVARARLAQSQWGRSTFAERVRVLGHILDHVLDHAEELVDVVVRDAGKTRENAAMGEIWTVAEKLRWTIRHGERWLRPEARSTGFLVHKRGRVEFEPLGVIGVICPWNYPLQNVLGPAIPALMAGNGVVIKVSEHVAWSSGRIQRIFDEALQASGHSSDLVKIINGYGDVGAALTTAGVDGVVFTGSQGNGKKVLAASTERLVPCVLELGGKDPLVVCDDADLERAHHAALTGAFIASGQNCLAAERILVFDAVYDQFVESLRRAVQALRQGPPLGGTVVDVGAMTMEGQLEIVERLVEDAVAKGARLLAGGKRGSGPGQYFEPTLLADVTAEMAIFREEAFGPVACVVRVRDEAHAVEVANDSDYALGCTIMTRDQGRAARMARGIRAGCVSVNDFALTYMAQALPFGGVGGSGFGRLNGPEGLRACTNPKAIIEDRFSWGLPPSAIFPVREHDHALVREAVRLLYGRGVGRKVQAAKALLALWRQRRR